MKFDRNIGEPIPTGIIGRDGTPLTYEKFEDERRAEDSAKQVADIKEELLQLRDMISRLTETTARYAQQRVQNAAQTAVDRYPVASIAAAALVGYWLAGRRR